MISHKVCNAKALVSRFPIICCRENVSVQYQA